MSIQTLVRDYLPDRIHEFGIGIHNSRKYKMRYSKHYHERRKYYAKWTWF